MEPLPSKDVVVSSGHLPESALSSRLLWRSSTPLSRSQDFPPRPMGGLVDGIFYTVILFLIFRLECLRR